MGQRITPQALAILTSGRKPHSHSHRRPGEQRRHRDLLRGSWRRWLVLAVVPYVLVPALCLLMIVPAVIVLVLTHSANNHVISFINAEGKRFGLVLSGHSHPLSAGMFAACVALTWGSRSCSGCSDTAPTCG